MFWIRQLYNLSPASPDFLNLTDEQIDLEYELYKQQHPEKFKDSEESYHDPDYEQWEKEAAEQDSRIIIDADGGTLVRNNVPSTGSDEWEDIPVYDE